MNPTGIIFALAALLLLPQGAIQACLACNIHNYLAPSICTSSNVVIGKVLERTNDSTVNIEVVRKLYGRLRAGQKATMRAWCSPTDVGRSFVFCDPTCAPPTFEVLPLELEDEVAFLLRLWDLQTAGKPATNRAIRWTMEIEEKTLRQYCVRNEAEAIRLVQGISNESKQIGMEYLRQCRPSPVPGIIHALEATRANAANDDTDLDAAEHADNLLEALMVCGTAEAQKYVVDETIALLQAPSAPINWTNQPMTKTFRAAYLTALLGVASTNWHPWMYAYQVPYRKDFPAMVAQQRKQFLTVYPQLKGILLAEVTAALCETKNSTVGELLQLASKEAGDDCALGVYWYAAQRAHPFMGSEMAPALADLQRTIPLVTQPILRSAFSQRIQFAEDCLRKK